MHPNEEYQRIYEDDCAEAREARAAARAAAQAEWDQRTKAELATRNKGRNGKKFKEIGLIDFHQSLAAELTTKYQFDALSAALDAARDARSARLYELAKSVAFEPNDSAYWLVKQSSADDYRSIGSGHTYARGALAPLADRLVSLGFTIHIQTGDSPYLWNYRLWVNCPEWMADAAQRTLTMADHLRAWNKAGCNARVFWPFLSHDIDIYAAEYRSA